MSGFEITCGNCGEKSPFDQWLDALDLPANCYRCPKCHVVIRRTEGTPRALNIGDKTMIIPGEITLERVGGEYGAGM